MKKIPFMDKIFTRDDKEYYVYVPGTTHLEEDRFGNPRYVYDYYYLDSDFNKCMAKSIPLTGEDDSVWIKPTKEELEEYKRVLASQEEKQVKKLA
jgi:hypothetical protein